MAASCRLSQRELRPIRRSETLPYATVGRPRRHSGWISNLSSAGIYPELLYNTVGRCLVLSLTGGAIYMFCTAVGEFFYHTNVKTPRWIGDILQGPEMRRIHHEYARHLNDHGDMV